MLLVGLIAGAARPAKADDKSLSHPLNPVRLQLKSHPQFEFAGYYAAKAKGYYEQEGLDVTILEGGIDRPTVPQVVGGKADFGVSDASLLLKYMQDEPVVALAAIFQHSPEVLVSRQDSGIRSLSNLRGKLVMPTDEESLATLKAMVKREGMSLESVRVLPYQPGLQALINGDADVISGYLSVEPFHLRAQGIESNVIRAMDYGIDFYGDTLFTSRQQIEHNPAGVEAFRRASLKGWEYAMAHPEEIVALIAAMPAAKDRGTTPQLLQQEANAMRDLILPGLVEMGHMNPGRWEMIARVYVEAGRLPADHRALADFIYEPDHIKMLPGWFAPAAAMAGAAILFSLLAIFWNVQLRRLVGKRTAELSAQMHYGRRTSQQLYFFKWLMDQSADPFYIMSPAKGFRMIYANTSACDHFGLSRPELLNMSWPQLNPHFTQASCAELLQNLRSRKSMVFETEHRHSSGRIIAVEISANRLQRGNDELIAGYFRDISERRRSQDTMSRAKQEAESTSRAKDRFLAMLSHELRTPLTPVLAEVSSLCEDEETPAHLLPALEMIDRNIRLEARLIDDLLDLTRVSAGKLRLSCEVLDIHTALRRSVEICQPEISRQRLEVTLQLGAKNHLISGDGARIQQVFWNLLKNATKFTPAGGRISICTDNELAAEGESPILRIRVIDNGIGLSKHNITKVFDAFEQADKEVAKRSGGLGLGLAISRSIAVAHGGTIDAQSEGPHCGSTFTVRLKSLKQQHLEARSRRSGSGHPGTDAPPSDFRRVLLVEDNPDTLRVLERLMTRAGWEVRSADSVAQAIAASAQDQFDILVSDIGLPDGSGLDVMRRLGRRVRGIALSGYGMDEDIARSREAGFDAHITKPIDFKSLQQVMRSLARPREDTKNNSSDI